MSDLRICLKFHSWNRLEGLLRRAYPSARINAVVWSICSLLVRRCLLSKITSFRAHLIVATRFQSLFHRRWPILASSARGLATPAISSPCVHELSMFSWLASAKFTTSSSVISRAKDNPANVNKSNNLDILTAISFKFRSREGHE